MAPQTLCLFHSPGTNVTNLTLPACRIYIQQDIGKSLVLGQADSQSFKSVIAHWEKLLDSDWLRHCEFIRNLRENSVIRGKLQISRAKSVIHSECKYKQELRINN